MILRNSYLFVWHLSSYHSMKICCVTQVLGLQSVKKCTLIYGMNDEETSARLNLKHGSAHFTALNNFQMIFKFESKQI